MPALKHSLWFRSPPSSKGSVGDTRKKATIPNERTLFQTMIALCVRMCDSCTVTEQIQENFSLETKANIYVTIMERESEKNRLET